MGQGRRQLTRASPGLTACHELVSINTRPFDGLRGGYAEAGVRGWIEGGDTADLRHGLESTKSESVRGKFPIKA